MRERPKISLPGLVLRAYLTAAEFVPGARVPGAGYPSCAVGEVGSQLQTVLEDHATSNLATHGDHGAETVCRDAVGLVTADGKPVSKVTMNDTLDLGGLVATPEDPEPDSVMSSDIGSGDFESANGGILPSTPAPISYRRGRQAWKKLDIWE